MEQPLSEAMAIDAKAKAKIVADSGQIPVVVAYRTPAERARHTAKKNVISLSIAATVSTVLIPIFLQFLAGGDFSTKALTTLAISVITGILMLILNWAQKYRDSQAEDQS